MSFLRVRCVGGKYYASLVQSYREKGKKRQRVVQNYGRVKRSWFRRWLGMKPSQGEVDKVVGK